MPTESSPTLSPVYQAHLQVLNSLLYKIHSIENKSSDIEKARTMIMEIVLNGSEWPIDKVGRWTGFIQGVLYKEGLLDIEEERNETRPIFHKAYSDIGLKNVKTVSV